MSIFEQDHGSFVISTDPRRLDVDLVHAWLSTDSYWAQGRTRTTVEHSLAASLNFGAYVGESMVGAARVVGDGLTFGWLCDVFVLENHRRAGIGKALVAAVVEHPEVRDLKRLVLATADAQDLYAQFGFVSMDEPDRWMIRSGPTD